MYEIGLLRQEPQPPALFSPRCGMRQATHCYRLFVGIDIAARTFTVASMHRGQTPSRAQTFSQTRSGFAQLQRHLLTLEPEPTAVLVVMEATGTYWMRLALALIEAHI